MILSPAIIIKHLGTPRKIEGNEWLYQCTICRDSKKDNLKYNHYKNVLFCFADPEHSKQILSEIFKAEKANNNGCFNIQYKNKSTEVKPEIKRPTAEQQQEWQEFQKECSNYLLNNIELLRIAKQARGIKPETIKDLGVGYSSKLKKWVFPVFSLKNKEIAGFEFRPDKNLSKQHIHKTKAEDGTYNCLAEINKRTENTQYLVIIEGFIDGYLFYQYMTELELADQYHIITPANGIGAILSLMEDVNFSKYQNVYLYLDSDKPDKKGQSLGIETMQKIIQLYPINEENIIIMKCGCKDFAQHYTTCIKKTD